MIVYLDGTGTTAASAITNTSDTMLIGGGNSGTQSITEIAVVFGQGLSSTQMSAISAGAHSYWGF